MSEQAGTSGGLPDSGPKPYGNPYLAGLFLGGTLLASFLVLGAGLGTFGGIFPRYRPLAVQSTYTHAHQDYLQWFAETGFLGVLCALLFAGGLIVVATRSLRPRAYGHGRYMACGLIAGLGGLALHGLVDFNGHIPANTLMAAVMAGMLVVLARPLPGERAT